MARNVLAIDPGAARPGCACAWFDAGRLAEADFQDYPHTWPASCSGGSVIVVERPEYQGQRTLHARPQDLIALAWAGARAAAYAAGESCAEIVELTPSQWKGSEPKPVHHARVWALLADAERALLGGAATARAITAAVDTGAANRWGKPGVAYYARSFKTHNVLDATALGLFYLGRLAKR